jgi:hypothetical protein
VVITVKVIVLVLLVFVLIPPCLGHGIDVDYMSIQFFYGPEIENQHLNNGDVDYLGSSLALRSGFFLNEKESWFFDVGLIGLSYKFSMDDQGCHGDLYALGLEMSVGYKYNILDIYLTLELSGGLLYANPNNEHSKIFNDHSILGDISISAGVEIPCTETYSVFVKIKGKHNSKLSKGDKGGNPLGYSVGFILRF